MENSYKKGRYWIYKYLLGSESTQIWQKIKNKIMCWFKTRFKMNHLPHNVSTFKNLTHYIATFITESDYHCRVNIWRFNILLTSLTLKSNLCSLRTKCVIIYSVRWNVEPELDDFVTWLCTIHSRWFHCSVSVTGSHSKPNLQPSPTFLE